MKVVVAGLAPRDEVAFGIFLGRSMKSWTWQSAPAQRDAALPEADLIVLDLAAAGMARASPQAHTELLQWLRDTPAVLLVAAHDRSWSDLQLGAGTRRVCLAKPYGSEDMRQALEQAATRAFTPDLPATPPPPERRVAPVAPVERAVEATGLSLEAWRAGLDQLSTSGQHVFLHKLAQMLAQDQPFEARFTVQNSVIVHPQDGWVASNTPMLVIEQVCRSDNLASVVSMREITAAQAEERAHLLGMELRELDLFLAELLAAARGKPPLRRGTDRSQ